MQAVCLLKLPEVRARYAGSSKSTVYNHVRSGLLPKPVQISTQSVAWPSNEIDAVVAARIAGLSDEEVRALVSRLEARRAAVAQELQAA